MSFHDIRIPEFIETFAVGRPEFITSRVSTISGREVRSLDREHARQRYMIKNCCLSSTEFEQFSAFFRARRGGSFAFRFRDNSDYKVSNQPIAKGDGQLQQFQLIKLYEDGILPYSRKITKPVAGSEEFFVEGTKMVAKVDYDSGQVALLEPLDKDQVLIGSFLFDVAVRFANDSFEYFHSADGSIELSQIELLEVT